MHILHPIPHYSSLFECFLSSEQPVSHRLSHCRSPRLYSVLAELACIILDLYYLALFHEQLTKKLLTTCMEDLLHLNENEIVIVVCFHYKLYSSIRKDPKTN